MMWERGGGGGRGDKGEGVEKDGGLDGIRGWTLFW